jgi:hypothetical protein
VPLADIAASRSTDGSSGAANRCHANERAPEGTHRASPAPSLLVINTGTPHLARKLPPGYFVTRHNGADLGAPAVVALFDRRRLVCKI